MSDGRTPLPQVNDADPARNVLPVVGLDALAASAPLSWTLCIATLNRADALVECIRRALAQTRPALEVIVVDAGTDWAANRDRIADLMAAHPAIALHYLPALRRSTAIQRNQAIAAASGDILVMIDDDSFMYPDCVAALLAHYESPQGHQIAGVSAVHVPEPPDDRATAIDRKQSGLNTVNDTENRVMRNPILRWIYREILMMAIDRDFVFYDPAKRHGTAQEFALLGQSNCYMTPLMPGYAFTVRRSIALREPFEPVFNSYSPAEDTDASYRMSRHGFLLVANTARLHHAQAASGRIKRRQATALRLMNLAYVTRKHSVGHRLRFGVFLARRTLAEFLKDLLSRRWAFPQFRGALYAATRIVPLFRHPADDLERWYADEQTKVLAT